MKNNCISTDTGETETDEEQKKVQFEEWEDGDSIEKGRQAHDKSTIPVDRIKQLTRNASKLFGRRQAHDKSTIDRIKQLTRDASTLFGSGYFTADSTGTGMYHSLTNKWPHLTLTLFFTITGWSALIGLGLAGWPGETNGHNCYEDYLTAEGCFCERPRPNRIMAQPVNASSNLIYSFVAVFLSWCADTKRFPNPTWWSSHINLLTQEEYFTLSFGPVLTNIGYSSGFLHSGWTTWGDKLDSLAILLMFLWLVLFAICKFVLMWKGWSVERMRLASKCHAVAFCTIGITLYIVDFCNAFYVNSLFEAIGIFVLSEIIVRYVYSVCKNKERTSRGWIAVVSVIFFCAGYFVQQVTQSGSKFCWPESFLQGHAIWHLCSALGVFFAYIYLLSDKFTMRHRATQPINVDDILVMVEGFHQPASVE